MNVSVNFCGRTEIRISKEQYEAPFPRKFQSFRPQGGTSFFLQIPAIPTTGRNLSDCIEDSPNNNNYV